jgi:hypothetical protein
LARQSPQHHVESNLGVSFPVGIPTFPAVPLTILEQMSFGPEGSSPREFSAWLCTYRSAKAPRQENSQHGYAPIGAHAWQVPALGSACGVH